METRVKIDYLGQRGDGVASFEGRSVYVPRTAAGDEADVTLIDKKDILLGRMEKLLTPGSDRIAAPCPHYDACGGCQIQHITLHAYQHWKEMSVRRQFDQAGITPGNWLPSVFIPHATRRRVTFGAIRKGKELTLGFNAWRSDHLVDQTVCLLLTPALNELRDRMRPYLLKLLPDSVVTDISVQDVDGAIDLLLTGNFADLSFSKMDVLAAMAHDLGLARISSRAKALAETETLLSLQPVRKSFADLSVDLPPGAFMQPSREGEMALVSAVLAACGKVKKRKMIDLFAGCGTFSGPLLQFGSVHAVEGDRAAVQALQKSLGRVKGLSTERRDLFAEPVTVRELNMYDCAVFDPPRAGAQKQAEMLAKSKVPLVIGVSCNPQTLARDSAVLIAGGYRLETLQMVDQFIWSSHSEVIAQFRRGA